MCVCVSVCVCVCQSRSDGGLGGGGGGGGGSEPANIILRREAPVAEEVANERHDARGRRHRGNPGLAWRDARRRRGGGPKFIAHPPQRNKRAPLGAAVLDALKHGKGGMGNQSERKRQARTSSRLVPRLTQFHLASAGVQWWKPQIAISVCMKEAECPERTGFLKEEKKKPRVPLGYRGKDPPQVSPDLQSG